MDAASPRPVRRASVASGRNSHSNHDGACDIDILLPRHLFRWLFTTDALDRRGHLHGKGRATPTLVFGVRVLKLKSLAHRIGLPVYVRSDQKKQALVTHVHG